MKPISYARHCFPPEVIRHPLWLCFRFTLSYRDAEDILAERGIEVSNESIRRWVLKIWTRDYNEICVEHDLGLMINGISTRSLSRFPDSGYECGGPSK
jgi:transposase-like protein